MRGPFSTLAGITLILVVIAVIVLSGAGSHPCQISCFGSAPVPAATAVAGRTR